MCCSQFYKNNWILQHPKNYNDNNYLETIIPDNNHVENNNSNYEIVKIPLSEQLYYIFGSLICIIMIYVIIIDLLKQKKY